MKNYQKGFLLTAIIIIVAIVALGAGFYYLQKSKITNIPVTSVQETNDNILVPATASQIAPSQSTTSDIVTKAQPSNSIITTSASTGLPFTFEQLYLQNKGKSYSCVRTLSEFKIESTLYVNGDMLRGTTTVTSPTEKDSGEVILKDGKLYNWNVYHGETGVGSIYTVDKNTRIMGTNDYIDYFIGTNNKDGDGNQIKNVKLTCSPLTPDTSKFVPPASVQFTDQGSVLNN